MSAHRRYRLVTTNGVLAERIGLFGRLDRANARVDEILADPRSSREDDWLVLIDLETHGHVRVEGRGKYAGEPLPQFRRTA